VNFGVRSPEIGLSFRNSYRGALVSGIDAAEGLVAIARERVPDGDFRVGDIESLPFGNEHDLGLEPHRDPPGDRRSGGVGLPGCANQPSNSPVHPSW
jgi:hypothetical protein